MNSLGSRSDFEYLGVLKARALRLKKLTYHDDRQLEVHAFSVHSVLHTSHLVEDNGTLTTIYYESESGEDDAAQDETATDLAESIEEPFYHI